MGFESAQNFFLDPSVVGGAAEIGVSCVDLYFKAKPEPLNNRSGIQYPGASVYVLPTANSVPQITDQLIVSRVQYNDIQVSGDSSVATRFRFQPAIQISTGRLYSILIKFDGDEDFQLWTAHKGDTIVGTTTQWPGVHDSFIGAYYTYISTTPLGAASSSNSNMVASGNSSSNSQYATPGISDVSWKALTDTFLKFQISVARYAISGDYSLANGANGFANGAVISPYEVTVNNVSGEVTFSLPALRYEYVAYDRPTSSHQNVLVGERAYQNTVFWPPGAASPSVVSLVDGSNRVTAVSNNINWSTLLNVGGKDPEFLVFTSRNHLGANADIVAVRQVVGVISNTVIQLDEPANFNNSSCYFFRSPVAVVDQFKAARFFGANIDVMILRESTANTSMRFVNDSILSATVVAGGTGYSNTDYITFTGFENVANKVLGGYVANATLVTNSTGGITGTFMSNLGCGFVNTNAVAFAITNATGGATGGSGANIAANTGSIIKTEFLGQDGKGGAFVACRLINIEIGEEIPGLILNNPSGTIYQAQHRLPYYSVDDAAVLGGKVYRCDSDGNWDQFDIKTKRVHHSWDFNKRRCVMSWSRELVTPYANGSSSHGLGGSTNGNSIGFVSNSSVMIIRQASNSDFSALTAAPVTSTMTFSRFIINNDYTGENHNYGNAWARGIDVKFNLANNHFAEDLLVYATVHRPAVTNVVAFARLYNSNDPDAFDDKDWTMLELRQGQNVFSSVTNVDDMLELTWGLQSHPNTAFELQGVVTTVLSNNTLVGVGTDWSANLTQNVQVNDLVLLYQPLFPNNQMIALVTGVANNTRITLDQPISNNGLVGSGLKLQKIAYPLQAYNNYLNENVARYYNTSFVPFDTFDVAQVKLVMLSSDGMVIPLCDDIRAVAVSS